MPWRKKETKAFEDCSKSLFVLSDRGWVVSMCLKEKKVRWDLQLLVLGGKMLPSAITEQAETLTFKSWGVVGASV